MNHLLLQIQSILDQSLDGTVNVPDEIVEELGEAVKAAFRKQFTDERRKFSHRLSNVGKPLCQLQMEKAEVPAERKSPWFQMQMVIGDIHEAVLVAVIKLAGIKVVSLQEKVKLDLLNGTAINGTMDIVIEQDGEEVVYDIKSASSRSFITKFSRGFEAVKKNDPFGYVAQGYGYARASGRRFGGWIVSDKSTGEIAVVEAPADKEVEQEAIDKLTANLKALVEDRPFARLYEDEYETFKKKPTGNKILGETCSYCDFKNTCWPDLKLMPAVFSDAKDPPLRYYTELNNTKEN